MYPLSAAAAELNEIVRSAWQEKDYPNRIRLAEHFVCTALFLVLGEGLTGFGLTRVTCAGGTWAPSCCR